jgi:hypothetical protein
MNITIKKMMAIFMFVLIVPALAAAAPSPGTVSYTPDAVTQTIPAGSSANFAVSYDVIGSTLSVYLIKFPYLMLDGNLPLAWVSSSPYSKVLFPGTPVQSMLTVSVPVGTPSGIYAAHLASMAYASHGIASAGSGVLISITVPPLCSSVAEIRIASASPEVLWPPNHSMQDVTVSGAVVVPAGCSILEAGYAIDDEYGVLTSVGTLSLDFENNFTVSLPIEAWREGQDMNGRHYTITFFARDEAGIGAGEPVTIVVPHDQRK